MRISGGRVPAAARLHPGAPLERHADMNNEPPRAADEDIWHDIIALQPRLHTGRSPRAAALAPNITCILDKILDRGWHRGGIGGQRGCIGGEYVHSLTRAPPWAGVRFRPLRVCRTCLQFADRFRAGAGRRSGSGWRQGRVCWGRPLLSRPRGAVGSGPAAVESRPRLRSSR